MAESGEGGSVIIQVRLVEHDPRDGRGKALEAVDQGIKIGHLKDDNVLAGVVPLVGLVRVFLGKKKPGMHSLGGLQTGSKIVTHDDVELRKGGLRDLGEGHAEILPLSHPVSRGF